MSLDEFTVSSKVLQNEQNAKRVWHDKDFRHLGNRGEHRQSGMHHLDLGTGAIFFAEIEKNTIGCINIANPINTQHRAILETDDERMIYPSDLKV